MSLLELMGAFAQPASRPAAAQALAAQLRCHEIIVFIRDPELDIMLPAPGFPQTLPGGRVWRDFVSACLETQQYTGELPFPNRVTVHPAVGVTGTDGSVLVLLGEPASPSQVEEVRLLLPLLGGVFRGEHMTRIAEGHASVARQTAERERTLALSLDTARHDLQTALSEMHAAQERLSFLAEASAAFSTSLDITAILASVTRLVVPRFAAFCLVVIADEDHEMHQYALAHTEAQQPHQIRHLIEHRTLDRIMFDDLYGNIQGHHATLRSEFPPAMLRFVAQDEEHAASLRDLRLGAAVVAPLSARGKVLGSLWIGATGRRTFDERDREFVEDLARRAALAIDNGRLYEAARASIRTRDAFLSLASHELKTPVTSLVAYSELLLRRAAREQTIGERDQRALQVMYQQAERLARLIDTLLDVSRIESGYVDLDLRPVDLGQLVQRVVDNNAMILEHHAFDIERPEEPVLINGDVLRLEQVVQNLVQNAVKYSPGGGSISIVVERRAEHGTITVTDHGIGIAKEALPHLFQRFYRAEGVVKTMISGMGLGLFIVHDIVTRHGGSVEVSSSEGVGSTFVVYLPI